MARSAPWLLALAVLLGTYPAEAADVERLGPATAPVAVQPAPVVAEDAPPPFFAPKPQVSGPLLPPPQIRYGCQRVWRCDTTVCEWRRGCWGVYGYVEGPYYTQAFIRRQAETHGLISPRSRHQYK